MEFDLVSFLINVIISTVVLSPVLWLSGRAFVGKEKARFTDAIWIVLIGTVLGAIFGAFNLGLIGAIIQLILWLGLIKHFFDCGWLKAFAISILAVIIFIIIGVILAIIGIAVFILWF